jgi:hypothetical protein
MSRNKTDKKEETKPERYSEASLKQLFESAKAEDIEVDLALKDFQHVKDEALKAGKTRSYAVRQMEAELLSLK